jgi:hypothetical protein
VAAELTSSEATFLNFFTNVIGAFLNGYLLMVLVPHFDAIGLTPADPSYWRCVWFVLLSASIVQYLTGKHQQPV